MSGSGPMTPQQINLFNPALKKQREWLTLGNLALASGALAVVLVLVGVGLRWQAAAHKQELLVLDQQAEALRAQVVQLSSDAAGQQASAELTRLQNQLAGRRAVLVALRSGAGQGESTQGFAAYLQGLARQTVPGLWLTGFSVSQGGGGMELQGRMLVADRLPDYLRRLTREPVFRGRQFVHLELARPVGNDRAAGDRRTPFNEFHLSAVPPSGRKAP